MRQHTEVLNRTGKHGVVPDDGDHVVGRDQRCSKKAQLFHRTGDATGRDEVAHFVRAKDLHKHASRKVRQQATPCGTDREACACEQRSKGGRFDTKDIKNRENQNDVEQHRNDGGQVVGQCLVYFSTTLQTRTQEAQRHANQPAANNPGGQRAHELQTEVRTLGA